jgi:C4-dicarboxylate-specific signal transduction histidine kinase
MAHVTLSAGPAAMLERLSLDLPSDQMPELVGRLFHGGELRIASVDRELTGYPADQRLLQGLGTRSVLALPLPGKDRAVGVISLGMLQRERLWTDAEVQELRLVAQVFSNVLRRQDAEAEMDRQAQEAAHASRVATLGELAASLAHELNQPLTAILSNANAARRFLDAEPPDLKEVRDSLADIAADDRRASEVIQRIRAMLRKGELERRALDLDELVTDAARLVLSDAVLRQVRIDEHLGASVVPVFGDRVQLQQVILNLLLNGLDASAELPHPRRIVIATGAWNQEATVTVRDWGPGIPTGALAYIFEPFYTTTRTGLGMGLSISRSIVEAHGGRIWAANNSDGGASVGFAIPGNGGFPT